MAIERIRFGPLAPGDVLVKVAAASLCHTDLEVIEAELAAYVPHGQLGGIPLAERVRVVVLNNADVPEARELAEMVRPDLEEQGYQVHIVSAVAHQGLKELTFALAAHVRRARDEQRTCSGGARREGPHRGNATPPAPA